MPLWLQDEGGQGRFHELVVEAEKGHLRDEVEGLQQVDRGSESYQIGRQKETEKGRQVSFGRFYTKLIFLRKLFQSTGLYIKGILRVSAS